MIKEILKKIIKGMYYLLLLFLIPKKKINKSILKATIKAFNLNDLQALNCEKIIETYFNLGYKSINQLAYILATVFHESKFYLIEEVRASATKNPSLYNTQNKYWLSGYYGRGFVQLTWFDNYEKFSILLDVDLVNNPDLALNEEIASKILITGMQQGMFTGVGLPRYINETLNDSYNARRVVNGTDKADVIEQYYFDVLNNIQEQKKG